MKIGSKLGHEIINRISEYVDVDINIMDLNGKIVASTDSDRLNKVHSGAKEVIKTEQALILNEADISEYKGSRPGVNLPLMYQDKIEGVLGVSGNPNEILPMTGLIRVSVEILIEQLYIQKDAVYEERKWSAWLQQLLHPSGYDEETLEQEAFHSLGVDTNFAWKVIVLLENRIDYYLSMIEQKLNEQKVSVLFVLPYEKNEVMIVLSAEHDDLTVLIDAFSELPLSNLRIGVGEKHFGINGIRDSYNQAKQALIFGNGKQMVSYISDWKIERLANSIPTKEYNQICLHYEKKLNNMEEMYIKTIKTYLTSNFSIKKTATLLHIHRNTLLYRLEKIHEKIGLDPRLFHDVFILKVMLSKRH